MVLNQKLSCEGGDSLSDKVGSLIIDQNPRTSKPSNYVLKDKSCCCVCRTIPNNFGPNPTSQVIDCGNNISCL
jgi:hypothetical protein